MTDLQICFFLANELSGYATRVPSTALEANVLVSSGATIQVDTTLAEIGAPQNRWQYAVVEFLTGNAQGMTAVVNNVHTDVITLMQNLTFAGIQTGDRIRLHRGPLGEAVVFRQQPMSLDATIKNGKRFFAIVDCTGGSHYNRGLGADTGRGGFSISVSCETPRHIGIPGNVEDARRIALELPTFKDQVIAICHAFRRQEKYGIKGDGDIEFIYVGLQREGSPWMDSAIIDFTVALT